MDYLMCFLCPPIALLMVNRAGQALANFFLIWLLWFPAVIHALVIVADEHAKQRQRETMGVLLYAQSPALYAQFVAPSLPPAPGSPVAVYGQYRHTQRVNPNPQLLAHRSRNVRVEEWLGWFSVAHPAWSALLLGTVIISTATIVITLFTR
jgi:uncharacterized membrane protein YqaE (UPF0057 family)